MDTATTKSTSIYTYNRRQLAARSCHSSLHHLSFLVSLPQNNPAGNYRSNNTRWKSKFRFEIRGSGSTPGRGFGSQQSGSSNTSDGTKKSSSARREDSSALLGQRKSSPQQSGPEPFKAPGLQSRTGGKSNITLDLQFEERLQAVRRSALAQRKEEEEKQFGAIDYDAPVESKSNTIGMGTKIGVGVAVVVFGLVFALGDFLPSGITNPSEEATSVDNRISDEERANLQKRLKQFEAILGTSPEDLTALEGAAVTAAELGEYTQAAPLLEDLSKKKTDDPDVFRLLGEVKYKLKDYEGSVAALRNSASMTKTIDFEVLRGLTNALIAAQKPDEAVNLLLASRERLNNMKSRNDESDGSVTRTISLVDPIQVDLLLGKAYSDWGHISDAVSVYDQIISSHPDDFRGYLAKGIILKVNGNSGDAERMFIQARFFAPEKAKALVDRYSR